MLPSDRPLAPEPVDQRTGAAVWQTGAHGCRVVFAGRGVPSDRAAALAAIDPEAPIPAWLRQIHSARVVAAETAGDRGEGDALVTRKAGVPLSIVTADCVPVLVAGPHGVAAIHAGWRGVAAGVVRATLRELDEASACVAWIGPAIGPCCYEVGEEVAAQIVAASHEGVVRRAPGRKPHLDLSSAVRWQLGEAGVGEIHALALCTRCLGDRLHSYRREGPAAGRNHAFIWKS